MFIKFVTLIVLSCALGSANVSVQSVHIADGDGDLNPQPLPPIMDDEFGFA